MCRGPIKSVIELEDVPYIYVANKDNKCRNQFLGTHRGNEKILILILITTPLLLLVSSLFGARAPQMDTNVRRATMCFDLPRESPYDMY